MERKVVNYTIKYFERGKDKEKLIRVSKISRDTIKAFGKCLADIQRAVDIEEEQNKIMQKMAKIIVSRDRARKEIRDLCKPLKDKMNKLQAEIPGSDVAFKSCVNVVQMVLYDNGIEDKELSSYRFWNKKTEQDDLIKFLYAVVFKDVQAGGDQNYDVDDDMLFAAMYKYYGPITKEDIGRMDLIEFQRAVDVCIKGGMPKEVVESIWRKRGDKAYLEMMMPRGKKDN